MRDAFCVVPSIKVGVTVTEIHLVAFSCDFCQILLSGFENESWMDIHISSFKGYIITPVNAIESSWIPDDGDGDV
jgi:hypothetical protein